MEAFVWDKVFVTGFETVDDQHHRLVDLVNELGNAIFADSAHEAEVLETIQELFKYAEYHFREEERLMGDAGIDDRHLLQHRSDHAHFLAEVLAIHSGLAKNKDSANSLMDFLTHWLTFHILGSDQNMARQLRSIASGATPAEAFEAEEKRSDPSTEPLLHALHGLFRQVSDRNRALVELNQSLEEKVAARTRELREANAGLEAMALQDSLTSLPNRRHAMANLRAAWRLAQDHNAPLSCMMIDADGFKWVNDHHGHDAGDLVLRSLGQALERIAPDGCFVCRLGGDEFLVLCPGLDLDTTLAAAEGILEGVQDLSVDLGALHWQGSISIGVATRQPSMTDHNDLVKKADESVYEAKRAGKGCVRAIQATAPLVGVAG